LKQRVIELEQENKHLKQQQHQQQTPAIQSIVAVHNDEDKETKKKKG